MRWIYLVALGSNRRGRAGGPAATVRAAAAAIGTIRLSPVIASAPLGPSFRRFANAVALLETTDAPPMLLARLQAIERGFGRRRGRRWGARVLDLDIVLWSGGRWRSRTLSIPHPAFADRHFVLEPAAALVPRWRDPASNLSVRQLAARLTRRHPLPS